MKACWHCADGSVHFLDRVEVAEEDLRVGKSIGVLRTPFQPFRQFCNLQPPCLNRRLVRAALRISRVQLRQQLWRE